MPGVSVVARLRPSSRSEIGLEHAVFTRGANEIECFKEGDKYVTSLDGVLDEHATQGET